MQGKKEQLGDNGGGGGPPGGGGKGALGGRDRGTEHGRDSPSDVPSRMKVVCAHSRKRGETRQGERREGRAGAPIVLQPREMGSDQKAEPSESRARAVRPEPPTKGHSQRGLIRDRGRAARPGHRLGQGPHTIAPLWEAGRALPPLIPRQEHASLPYSRETDWGRQRDAPLTVDALFLEVGRLFSIAAVSLPRVPLNAAQTGPHQSGRPSTPSPASRDVCMAVPGLRQLPGVQGSRTVPRAGAGAPETQGQAQTPLPTAAGGPTARTKATSPSVHSHRSARGHCARPASPSELMSADTSLLWANQPVRACVGQCPCPHLTPRPFS